MLLAINTIIPIAVVLVFQIKYKSTHDLHHGILTWFETFSLTICITDVLKVGAGRLRPDFLSRCLPSAIDGSCTNGDSALIRDGKLSFPSGHSSLSFACMTFVMLYLMSKLKLYDQERNRKFHTGGSFWKLIACISPLGIACFVAISRTLDYHHNFSDILAGCVLGIFVAIFCYFLNYPTLFSSDCDLPFNRYFMKNSYGNDDNSTLLNGGATVSVNTNTRESSNNNGSFRRSPSTQDNVLDQV